MADQRADAILRKRQAEDTAAGGGEARAQPKAKGAAKKGKPESKAKPKAEAKPKAKPKAKAKAKAKAELSKRGAAEEAEKAEEAAEAEEAEEAEEAANTKPEETKPTRKRRGDAYQKQAEKEAFLRKTKKEAEERMREDWNQPPSGSSGQPFQLQDDAAYVGGSESQLF